MTVKVVQACSTSLPLGSETGQCAGGEESRYFDSNDEEVSLAGTSGQATVVSWRVLDDRNLRIDARESAPPYR